MACSTVKCWLTPQQDHTLCATCEKKKQIELAEAFLLHQTSTDSEFLTFVRNPSNRTLFTTSFLELLLRKVYVSRRHLLPHVIHEIQLHTALHTFFYESLYKQHAPSPLCSVFQWLIRNSLIRSNHRLCCLKCIGNVILYSPLNAVYFAVYFLPQSHWYSHMRNLIHTTIHKINGRSVLKHLLLCIVESSYVTHRLTILFAILNVIQSSSEITHKALRSSLLEHPFFIQIYTPHGFSNPLLHPPLPFLKQRIDVFREEFTAKTWHPSRFVAWCLDLEEQEEFRQPDGSLYQSTLGGHWNLDWYHRD